jgi:hypothetical protein
MGDNLIPAERLARLLDCAIRSPGRTGALSPGPGNLGRGVGPSPIAIARCPPYSDQGRSEAEVFTGLINTSFGLCRLPSVDISAFLSR